MNIQELTEKYTNGELSDQTGDPELRCKEFSPLFRNLYENKVVYHERFTCIVKLENIELLPDRFSAKAIPHLLIEKGNKMDSFFPKKPWSIGSNWEYLRLSKSALVPYSGWLLWCDPELTRRVEVLVLEKKFREALDLTFNLFKR